MIYSKAKGGGESPTEVLVERGRHFTLRPTRIFVSPEIFVRGKMLRTVL